ncbi:phosphatidate cytidylyltransferase [Halomonas denitrificans]|uniref:phosphatidate cytidylyltransferase n=1 Tax=Halomonas TaxID=2745 RepID=UPI001C982E90|nr:MULTISPECIES: phosphatidate cytidylyltransferase [Halomonas]MBY5967952.1 phosphatidate cytidylyltransferase [Halomonas denitrificans]MBY6031142.1 phosphatidate cytidylyltransferase [Halomonas sp. DP8Y7-1]MBY6206263.1 phosphatidate cytidylyltransferase [Halomonas sp. DP3Y7-2]MBY6227846.1 phosphatidate cytidylyltransferase [Halomonas sp. DP3Y7-1]MCA0915913.1 phosphatidate cytidylyltransferase [Halomonas denitrificans]
MNDMVIPAGLGTLLAAIAGILVVASTIGFVLARRYSPGGENEVIENLNQRIRSWWLMAILMGIALLGGRTGVVLLFAFASFSALREFLSLIPSRRADHWALALVFFVVLPVQYVFIWQQYYGMYSIFIPVYAFLLLPVVAAIRGDSHGFLDRVSEVQWALMVCVFCVSHVPALLTLDIPGFEGRNVLLIAFLIVVVQLSDVLQYVWGKLIGRRKIAPRLSPSKTLEGFVGGVASATLVGAGLAWMTPFTLLQAALLALMIALLGFVGGLVMSAIKRDRGIKDWGHLIEGHGGFIDRLDSVIFSAPIFFHVVRYFWSVA